MKKVAIIIFFILNLKFKDILNVINKRQIIKIFKKTI